MSKGTERKKLGHWGERQAAEFLVAKGYEILDQNVRTPYGEIDIIARLGGRLVFVEVKTRSSDVFGHPEEAITDEKIVHMIESAQSFFQEHPELEDDWQIDVVSVQKLPGKETPEITHFANAIS